MKQTIKSEIPARPDWLKGQAADTWNETLEKLRDLPELLCRVDGPLLATYCEAWQTYLQANEIVQSEGLIATSKNNVPFQHPAVGIRSKARTEILRIGAKFGLSPIDRQKLGVVTSDSTHDPAAEFIA